MSIAVTYWPFSSEYISASKYIAVAAAGPEDTVAVEEDNVDV